MMAALKSIVAQDSRNLPIFFLMDTSASMARESKLIALESAVGKMLGSFNSKSPESLNYHICLISFGGDNPELVTALKPASKVSRPRLEAKGRTPLGGAFRLLKEQLESQELPTNSYSPIVILMTDGYATDAWRDAFKELKQNPWFERSQRVALAIGSGSDRDMLAEFLGDFGESLFEASEASDIFRFIRAVTVSIAAMKKDVEPAVGRNKINKFSLVVSREYARAIPDCWEDGFD